MRLKNKKILITGGAGFIGSYLIEKLYINNNLTVIDNLSTGKISNIKKFQENIQFIKTDINKYKFNNKIKFDLVIHLAAQTSVPFSIQNFYKSSKINMDLSIKILNYCYSNKIPYIYASSSAVYGNLKSGKDFISKFDIINPYAADKLNLENYSDAIYSLKKIPNIGLRFFNVFGARQDPNSIYSGVVSIFIKKALMKKKITINGGFQTRDFIHVYDVVKSIIKSSELVLSKNICEKVNILTGKSTSINKLFNDISKLTNYNKKPLYKKIQPGDSLKSTGNCSKMNKLLLKKNDILSLKEGLKITLEEITKNEFK